MQNTCLHTSTPERKGQNRGKVQNMMYEVRTKSKDKVRMDKTSYTQHALNRDRYKYVIKGIRKQILVQDICISFDRSQRIFYA
jgi:hypothetical protein